jgi:hypothetical protein
MPSFAEKTITSWRDFHEFVLEQTSSTSDRWIYRGQTEKKWSLKTTIERALSDWEIEPKCATLIEFQTIREFRRRLRDPEHDRVHTDTLFCLALMQHYGAPTRLWIAATLPSAQLLLRWKKAGRECRSFGVLA